MPNFGKSFLEQEFGIPNSLSIIDFQPFFDTGYLTVRVRESRRQLRFWPTAYQPSDRRAIDRPSVTADQLHKLLLCFIVVTLVQSIQDDEEGWFNRLRVSGSEKTKGINDERMKLSGPIFVQDGGVFG
jgi:hypothetical protein